MLPCPSVILAMMLLPQRMSQTPPLISSKTIIDIIQRIILRFLDIGFLTFLDFLDFLDWREGVDGVVGVEEAVSSPLVPSKSKT